MGIENSILNTSNTLDITNGATIGTGLTITSGDLTLSSGSMKMINAVNDTSAPIINFHKSRAGGVVTSGDWFGSVIFYGHEGTNFIDVGRILSYGGGTVATNRIFSSINFRVHKDTTDAALNALILNGDGSLSTAYSTSGTFGFKINSMLPIYLGYITTTSAASGIRCRYSTGSSCGFGAICASGDSLDEMSHFSGGHDSYSIGATLRYSSILICPGDIGYSTATRSIVISARRFFGGSGTIDKCICINAADLAFSAYSKNMTGNIGIGLEVFRQPTNINYCTGVGYFAFRGITSGTGYNTSFGFIAYALTAAAGNGYYNTAMGYYALAYGGRNGQNESCACGYQSLMYTTTNALRNIAIGYRAGYTGAACTTTYNILLGSKTGTSYTTTESNNILIGSEVLGTATESNVLRIGKATGTSTGEVNKAFISGIYNISIGATAGVAIVDSTNQVGTLSASAGCMFMGGTKPAFSAATYPITTSQGDILISSSADTVESLAKNTSSTRYLSNTGTSNNPAWAQVNLANGVTGVLPAANGGALAYTEVTDGSSSINMASNSGYIVNDSDDDVTFVLPESPSVGDVFGIVGYSSNGWSVTVYATATQDIIYNGTAYNTITSAARYDCVEIRYIASNTFAVSRYTGSPTGS